MNAFVAFLADLAGCLWEFFLNKWPEFLALMTFFTVVPVLFLFFYTVVLKKR